MPVRERVIDALVVKTLKAAGVDDFFDGQWLVKELPHDVHRKSDSFATHEPHQLEMVSVAERMARRRSSAFAHADSPVPSSTPTSSPGSRI